MNPFLSATSHANYSDFIWEQVKDLKVGESIKIDIGEKTIRDTRPTLQYLTRKTSFKFVTKLDVNENLWVKRVDKDK